MAAAPFFLLQYSLCNLGPESGPKLQKRCLPAALKLTDAQKQDGMAAAQGSDCYSPAQGRNWHGMGINNNRKKTAEQSCCSIPEGRWEVVTGDCHV